MPKSAFERLNRELLERGEEPFANPRNLTSGTLKQLDPALARSRQFDIWFYSIGRAEGFAPRTQKELLEGLESRELPGALTGIAHQEFLDKEIDEIRGSGYVVDSLEAGLWCVFHEENYRDAVLQAVNLGEDADSTAAIAGQLAGALYGAGSIPAPWLEMLAWKAEITDFADRLHEIVPDGSGAATSPGGGEGRSA